MARVIAFLGRDPDGRTAIRREAGSLPSLMASLRDGPGARTGFEHVRVGIPEGGDPDRVFDGVAAALARLQPVVLVVFSESERVRMLADLADLAGVVSTGCLRILCGPVVAHRPGWADAWPQFDVLIEGEVERTLADLFAALGPDGLLPEGWSAPGVSRRVDGGGIEHHPGRAASVDPEAVPSGVDRWLAIEGCSVPYGITRGGDGEAPREKGPARILEDLDGLTEIAAAVVLTDWDLSELSRDLGFAHEVARRFGEGDGARLSVVVAPENLALPTLEVLAAAPRFSEIRVPVASVDSAGALGRLPAGLRGRVVVLREFPVAPLQDEVVSLQALLDSGLYRIDGCLRQPCPWRVAGGGVDITAQQLGALHGIFEILAAAAALGADALLRWGGFVAKVGLPDLLVRIQEGVPPGQLRRILLLDALGVRGVDSALGRPGDAGWDLYACLGDVPGDGVGLVAGEEPGLELLPELHRFDPFFDAEGITIRERIEEDGRVRFLFLVGDREVGLWVIPASSPEDCYREIGALKIGYSGRLDNGALMDRFAAFVAALDAGVGRP
ncbi:MAG: hypothetical protein ABIK09_19780 [Pseudomonadota bacterium]